MEALGRHANYSSICYEHCPLIHAPVNVAEEAVEVQTMPKSCLEIFLDFLSSLITWPPGAMAETIVGPTVRDGEYNLFVSKAWSFYKTDPQVNS